MAVCRVCVCERCARVEKKQPFICHSHTHTHTHTPVMCHVLYRCDCVWLRERQHAHPCNLHPICENARTRARKHTQAHTFTCVRTSVRTCMQEATRAKTARATPGTRGPTAARAQRARRASTRTRQGPVHAPPVPPTPRRLQVCAASLRRTCQSTNNVYAMPMLRRRICSNPIYDIAHVLPTPCRLPVTPSSAASVLLPTRI